MKVMWNCSCSPVWLFVTPWTNRSPPRSSVYESLQARILEWAPLSMRFCRQEYWSGLPFSSPRVFQTQWSNLGLLHFRQILHHLIHQGSLKELDATKRFYVYMYIYIVCECAISLSVYIYLKGQSSKTKRAFCTLYTPINFSWSLRPLRSLPFLYHLSCYILGSSQTREIALSKGRGLVWSVVLKTLPVPFSVGPSREGKPFLFCVWAGTKL